VPSVGNGFVEVFGVARVLSVGGLLNEPIRLGGPLQLNIYRTSPFAYFILSSQDPDRLLSCSYVIPYVFDPVHQEYDVLR
jgi:hypothetical protein